MVDMGAYLVLFLQRKKLSYPIKNDIFGQSSSSNLGNLTQSFQWSAFTNFSYQSFLKKIQNFDFSLRN